MFHVNVKHGVSLAGLSSEMWVALGIAKLVYKEHGDQDLVVTAGTETPEVHKAKNTRHAYGDAADTRTRDFTKSVATVVAGAIRNLLAVLSSNYDVVLEGNHIHIEWDPNKKRSEEASA
jgi:hypothetical protein